MQNHNASLQAEPRNVRMNTIKQKQQMPIQPQIPFYVRLARRLRIAFPLLLFFFAVFIEIIEEIRAPYSHFGPEGPHEGFYLEVFAFGILSPVLVGLGFHWVAKIVEQLEASRALEKDLRQKLEREVEARRELLAVTVRSQEAERQRVARELHDGIGQPLTAFLLTSEAGDSQVFDSPTLQYARRAATSTLDAMRRLILDLRPSLLDAQGLLPALRQCAQDTLVPAAIDVQVKAVGTPYPIPDEVATALFRIGQESFTNILRYAQAQNVDIQLEYTPEQMHFTVKDDGIGFNPNGSNDNGRSLGLGLLSMQERAEQVNGRFNLSTQPGQGTCIAITIPMSNQKEPTI